MPADTAARDFSRRVAALTPRKLAVLQRRLVQTAGGADAPAGEQIPVQPRGELRDFPLSSAQERMWFNHQWSPDQPLYNESFGLTIHGALNPEILQRSFDFVMARHEIFTVTFHSSEGRLFQRLAGALAPRMEVRDLRNLDAAKREAAYETESRRLLREPFRLDQGPLFRAAVWAMGDDVYRVLFVMHHIIFDGWSGAIFFRELFTTYTALLAGREPELPALAAQYVDFAAWEQSHFEQTSANLDRQLEYWKKQLAGVPGPPPLPFDYHAASAGAHRAGRESFVCPAESAEALKELAKESGATLFMALLAVFNVLLGRYTGQEDIVVGLPTTNRNQSALRDIVGVFINTVALRTDLSGGVTFRELLGRVRNVTIDAQANQELPLQRVVRHLDLPGDTGRSLVSVIFDLQKKLSSFADSPDFAIEPMDTGNGAAKCDLVLAMEDTGAELKGALDYDAEKFEAASARQMARHFLALIDAAIAQPDIEIGKLPILTREELAQSEARGVDTSSQPQLFASVEAVRRAQERPEAIALSDQRGALSYRDLYARASRLAGFLRQQGAGAGQHVALFLPAGSELVTAQLAVMLAGAAFVPIDPAYPAARVEFMIRDSEARFVIVNGQSPELHLSPAQAIRMDREAGANSDGLDAPPVKPSDPAYLIYTSGSTGQPKGVSVSHAALANLIGWHRRAFQVTSGDRATQIASLSFDASIWEIWPYLAAGASIHFAPRELMANAPGMRDWLVKNKITASFAPTPLAEELIELQWPARLKLRYLLTGGDRLRKAPPAGLPFQLINNYGPTENAVVSTSGPVAAARKSAPPSIGRPIDNVWLRIVDRNLEPVPYGVAGELIAGGSSLASGYWKQPELTADAFVTLPDGRRAYRTGDVCRFRRDGELEFIGRADSQIKLRGCRIELGEIESALLAFEGIRQAAADVRDLPNGQRGIAAYFVAGTPPPNSEDLRVFLASRLPGHMMPSCFVPLEALPQTPNGKIDRKKLPAPEVPKQATGQVVVEPRTAAESRIAAIWKDLLNVAAVDVRDNFFHLGGDSLLATRFAVTIREKFGVELPLARMMSAPTVEALAAFVEAAHPNAGQLPGCLIPLRSGSDSVPPLFFAPPASGSPACYGALAGAMPGDRAVYGFEAPGLNGGKFVASIAMQARQYVAALNAVYPEGPCYVAGWSLGGPVAFEVACQLRAAGREVAYLALIDAGLPENGRLPGGASLLTPLWWALSYPIVERLPLNYETLRVLCRFVGIVLPESLSGVWRRGPLAGTRFAAGLVSSGWRSLRVFLGSVGGFKRFRPGPFDGAVTLFRTAQGGTIDKGRDALLNNVRRWSRDVEMHQAPGSHMTLMLDPKISSVFAASFEATLNNQYQNRTER